MSTQRIKDASFLQQHIEKLILVGGILVFVIAVFLFVIGNPFAIKLNNQTFSKPAQAVDVLVRTDDNLERGLNNPKPIPPVIIPAFREDFVAMMDPPINTLRTIARLSNPGLTWLAMIPDIPEPSRYALVYPPAPKNIQHVTGTDVLDKEFAPEITQAYYTLWNKELEEPGDFTMFIASGEFDIWQWVTRLKADPEAAEAIKIPAGIWAQRFGIAGVALLREEWDPQQGIWTNRIIVEPLPGQSRQLEDNAAPVETNEALALINRLRESQIDLAQPDLPWLDGFVQAVPPVGEGRDGEGVDDFLQQLDAKNLGPAEKEILKLEEKIQQLEARRAKRNERQGGAGPGGPADNFEGPAPGGERRDPITRQIDQHRERIARLQEQAAKEKVNRERMAELQRQREEERRRREAQRDERDRALIGPGNDPFAAAGLEGMGQLQEGASLTVWAADPSMQPGKTYRYKLLVSVINPLYAVPRLAADQLEENKQRAALLPTQQEIEAMDWIGPIKVEPESRFFFANGGESRARVEIYRRINGTLRVQDFDAAPGDRIGSIEEKLNDLGEPVPIDMTVDAILIDVERRRDIFSGSTVYTMVYADGEGNIHERVDAIDKSSPVRKDLRDEIQNGPEQALRPDLEATPGDQFGPGEFDPIGNF